jgi:chloramphenicol-sensitive protein RarD
MTQTEALSRAGLGLGIGAYTAWGLMPLYFKLLLGVPAVAIVAHRIVWSFLLLGALISLRAAWPAIRTALGPAATVRLLLATSALIGANWLLYVYAVNSGHILAASLGYYLNPLANILLGRFVLGEPLSRPQWVAVALAAWGFRSLRWGPCPTCGSAWHCAFPLRCTGCSGRWRRWRRRRGSGSRPPCCFRWRSDG